MGRIKETLLMTLTSNLMAFMLMFIIAMILILPLTIAVIALVPSTLVPAASLALPLVIYTTKTLLDWNTREL